ncbi:hypothetical protein GCM10010319_64410 [Streptomyces blastmyceticus]|uniref:Uncharacterized protein n=1 Tax=Streptomyces blastmyceticus TaxID=68180 RepID=A0ABN0XYG9_9ACTN
MPDRERQLPDGGGDLDEFHGVTLTGGRGTDDCFALRANDGRTGADPMAGFGAASIVGRENSP